MHGTFKSLDLYLLQISFAQITGQSVSVPFNMGRILLQKCIRSRVDLYFQLNYEIRSFIHTILFYFSTVLHILIFNVFCGDPLDDDDPCGSLTNGDYDYDHDV